MMTLVRGSGVAGRWCWRSWKNLGSWPPVRALAGCGGYGNTSTLPLGTSHPSNLNNNTSTFHSASRLMHTSSEDAGVRWRFPASDRVLAMIAKVNNHTWNNGLTLTCNTTKPLHPDMVHEMLTHLYNKMEVLRTCFRHRGTQLWIADMPKPAIDFKVVPWNDHNDEIQDLMSEPYNLSDGPLWKARLMPCPDHATCKYPDVKMAFPHQYNLLMCFHHAMVDGVTTNVISTTVFQLLEDMIAGNPVDDSKIGEIVGDSYIVGLEEQIRAKLEKDPERLKELLLKRSERKTPILVEAFGAPEVSQPRNVSRPGAPIDNEIIARLQNKCRARGVTLNSMFMGIFSTALVELVMEEGLVRDEYTVSTKHPVDLRRYINFDGPKANLHGYYSCPISHSMTLPYNNRKHFWENVKKFDTEFRDKLDRNYPCEEMVLDAMLRQPGYSHDEHFAKKIPSNYDFSFTNMYSGKEGHYGIGKHIQMTSMWAHSQITNCEFSLLVAVSSFRDQVLGGLFYSTGRVTPETAERYGEKARAIFKELSR